MIRLNTDNGVISVDSAVYTNIAGYAATNCFGVKGMAVRSMTDGLVHLLRKEAMGKGVRVTFHEDNSLTIDLHIVIDKGVNIRAIGSSIISEVRYFVTKSTGTEVRAVNVFVDSITMD
jgi:uncharacterized alkaline shock family protein YloU